MRHSTLLKLLLYAMLIILGMAIGYGIAASLYETPPFEPRVPEQATQMVEVMK